MSRFLREAFRPMEAYTPGEQPQISGLIKLNTNESPFTPAPQVLEAISKPQVEALRLYPDPSAAPLVRAIAKAQGVDPSQITVSNGSDESLAFAFLAFGENGVAFPDITYGFYRVWAQLFSLGYETIPLREDFRIDLDACRTHPAGLLVLANPNAPTGIALTTDALESLLAARKDRLVLVDEAYIAFGAQSALPLLARYDNLLIVRTFSKSHALAGARIGYTVSSPELAADLNKMKFSFNPYNLNRLSILAGEAAILSRNYYDQCCAKIVDNRDFLTEELRDRRGFRVFDSRANFLFAAPGDMDCRRYVEGLRARKILVRWFDADRIRGFARITIGTREQMETLLAATDDITKEGRCR